MSLKISEQNRKHSSNKPGPKLICEYCENTYDRQPYLNSRFCSRTCSNKFNKNKPWLGKMRTEETKKKISQAHTGRIPWNKGVKGIVKKNKGSFCKGNVPWNKGKSVPQFKGRNNPMWGVSGPDSPAWKGGLSFKKYSHKFNLQIKKNIRFLFGNTCQCCGVKEENLKKSLSVHHIDYNKKNTDISNLIPLCNRCHTKTNFNRDYWRDIFGKKSLC